MPLENNKHLPWATQSLRNYNFNWNITMRYKKGLCDPLKFSSEPQKKKRKKNPESAKAQIRPDSTVNCLVASLCLSRGTWGLNAAHFICWTTWELEPRALPWECMSVSRELTKPVPPHPPPFLRGPCTDGHSLVIWKNAYHCLTQRPPLPPPPPPQPPPSLLTHHHPVAAAAISSLHPSLTFSLWISLSGFPPPVPLWTVKELYYWPLLSVTANRMSPLSVLKLRNPPKVYISS